MNFDNLMRDARKDLRIYLWSSYFIEMLHAIAFSVIIAEVLSRILSTIIYQQSYEIMIHELIVFVGVSLGLILLSLVNRINAFFRTKKTAYYVEDKVYSYFFRIRYKNRIKKDEMQAVLTKTLPEYNSLYFSTVSETLRVGVMIGASVLYAATITPYSLIVVAFIAVLLAVILKGRMSALPQLREDITKYGNELYRNLWEGIENLEIERFLESDAVLERYRSNADELVNNRVKYNKIAVLAEFISQFGNIFSIVLMVVTGILVYGVDAQGISKILPLVIVVPSISTGFFKIPGLITNYRNIKGIKGFLNSYFVFDSFQDSDEDEGREILADAIRVEHVSFSYNGEENVLDKVSLEFREGQIATITGENGSGKSTLLRICALLIPIEEGAIGIVDGKGNELCLTNGCSDTDRKSYWRQIYYMDSEPQIIPGSFEKNIILNDEFDAARFADALRRAGLMDFSRHQVIDRNSISDGEAQKIAFARVFYHKYKVILLDESTSHMTPTSEERVMEELRAIAKEDSIIVIAVSHRESFNRYADRIYELKSCRIQVIN
ncbi:MAG: ATP-binding cassette domain-containing protein [Acetatifactor sp.]|nr:ATP-binding cassette domain-containing protein [Acetatifactor sp.]